CREQYFAEKHRSAQYRWYFEGVSQEHRGFVQGLRALKPPDAGETLFFESIPTHFDSIGLTAATQVALRRTDVQAERVDTFPVSAKYRLRFEHNSVITISPN